MPRLPNGSCALMRRERREISLHRTPRCTVSRRRTHPRGAPSLHSLSQRLGHRRNVSLNFLPPPSTFYLLFLLALDLFSRSPNRGGPSRSSGTLFGQPQKTGPCALRGSFPLPVRSSPPPSLFRWPGWLAGWWGWVAPDEPGAMPIDPVLPQTAAVLWA